MTFQQPLVDIIIPARNEQEYLGACLAALDAQTYPASRFHVYVVDDGSTDQTVAVARNYGVTVLSDWRKTEKDRRVSAVRNHGIKQSNSELVAFIDAHCVADPDWLDKMVQSFTDPDIGGCQGSIEYICTDKLAQKFLRSSMFSSPENLIEYTLSGRHSSYPWMVTGNCIYRRTAIEQAGLFDESVNHCEDVDLSWKVVLLGYRLVPSEHAQVTHYDRTPWYRFPLKYLDYGTGAAQLANRYGLAGPEVMKAAPGAMAWLMHGLYLAAYWWQMLKARRGTAPYSVPRQSPQILLKALRPEFCWKPGQMIALSDRVVYWSVCEEESIAVKPGGKARYVFRDTANFIFRQIAKGTSFARTVEELSEHYALPASTSAEVDVDEMMADLQQEGIVIKV